jgi:hypothetical protein
MGELPWHARNALARVSAHGSPPKKAVRAAVKRKFLGMEKKSRKG